MKTISVPAVGQCELWFVRSPLWAASFSISTVWSDPPSRIRRKSGSPCSGPSGCAEPSIRPRCCWRTKRRFPEEIPVEHQPLRTHEDRRPVRATPEQAVVRAASISTLVESRVDFPVDPIRATARSSPPCSCSRPQQGVFEHQKSFSSNALPSHRQAATVPTLFARFFRKVSRTRGNDPAAPAVLTPAEAGIVEIVGEIAASTVHLAFSTRDRSRISSRSRWERPSNIRRRDSGAFVVLRLPPVLIHAPRPSIVIPGALTTMGP